MREVFLGLTHDNYLSLSDIMVTEEKLLCTLTKDFHALGYIQPSAESEDGELAKNTTFDLPLWMVSPLRRADYADFQLPPAYQEEARRILCVDPGIVEFRQGSRCRFSQNHYPLGIYLLPLAQNDDLSVILHDKKRHKSLTIDEAREVRTSLSNTFILRFRQILNWSNSTGQDHVSQVSKRLDRSEKQLLDIGKLEQDLVMSWLRRKSQIIKPSAVTKNMRISTQTTDSRKRARTGV